MSVMRVIKRLIMSVSALWRPLMWSLSTLITPDLNMNYDHPAFHDSSNFLSRLLHYLHYPLLLLISDDGKIVCLFVFNWFDLFLSRHPIDPIPAWPIDRLLAPHCAGVKTRSDDNWGEYNNIWHPEYNRDKNISVVGYSHVDMGNMSDMGCFVARIEEKMVDISILLTQRMASLFLAAKKQL